eukprot:7063637-Alexandrium_andersonii.AAC.1
MPAEIARKISASTQKYYYQQWLQSGKDWAKVLIYEKVSKVNSESSQKLRQWKTRAQVLEHYKSETVTSAIIEEAKKDPN